MRREVGLRRFACLWILSFAPLAGAQTFTLTFNGQTTAPLSAGASAAQLQTALNALSTIGGAGGSVAIVQAGGTDTVTFGGMLGATDQPLMSGSGMGGASVMVSTLMDGGAPSEVQKVTVMGSMGTFTLTFNGSTTGTLGFNATAASVQGALNGLPTIGGAGGSVTVTQNANAYTIAFGGSLAGTNVSQMTAGGAGGATVSVSTISDGGPTSEMQTATVTGSMGTFTLTFNGSTTGSMLFNVAAAAMQANLNSLSSIGGVGGSVSVQLNANVYTITFGASLGGSNQPLMTATAGGGSSVATATQMNGGFVPSEVQQVVVTCSSDGVVPSVTAPASTAVTQTFCQ